LIRALILAGARQAQVLEPWLDYLARTGAVAAELVTDTGILARLSGFDVVVAHAPEPDLDAESEAGLCQFVEAGGGFVGLHCTNSRWSGSRRYQRMVGGTADGRLPKSEIVTDIADAGHDVTRRLVGGLTVIDSCFPQGETPSDSRILLRTTWRSRPLPVAYVREAGRGRVFYCGLGESAESYSSPSFQEALYRGLRFAAGKDETENIGVGLLGFGAIGDEHTAAIAAVPGLDLKAVCDRDSERVQAALRETPAALATTDVEQLLESKQVELVVISTPPNTHAPLALRALAAGKHVVVEKPFCLTGAEADRLVAAADAAGTTLSVYQNRRWDPDFLALQELVRGGALGQVFHLEAFVGGFDHPCHLWHSDSAVSGGVVYDWGSHYLDWILQLVQSDVVQVSASRQKLVWHDVTNDDHFELRLRFENGAEAQFIHSDIAAARKPKWYVLGTSGAAVGHWRESVIATRLGSAVVEESVPVADLPCELHVLRPGGAGRSHDERVVLPARPQHAFYRNLAGHLLAAEPLSVSPESARRNIAVMEAATTSAATAQPVLVRI
jgi:predicted dehydrogenase